MPYLTKTICNYPRCSKPVVHGKRYCETHKKEKPGASKKSHPWYHISRFRKARDRYVKKNPRCECGCGRLIQDISKRHLDHKIPFQTADTKQKQWELFWDRDNWQTLYQPCHTRKTKREMENQASDNDTFVLFGAPFSGKTTYATKHKDDEDLIVDVDLLFQALTGRERYVRPKSLIGLALDIREHIVDYISQNKGKHQAYVITTEADTQKRKKLIQRLDARSLVLDPGKDVCLQRAKQTNRIGKTDWEELIESWYDEFNSLKGDRIIYE